MTDRAPNGRFVKGNPGGPGRPPRATDQDYLDVLRDTLPLVRFAKIVDAYAKRAERGDTRAAEVLFKYVLPQVQTLRHAGADGEALSIRVIEITKSVEVASDEPLQD